MDFQCRKCVVLFLFISTTTLMPILGESILLEESSLKLIHNLTGGGEDRFQNIQSDQSRNDDSKSLGCYDHQGKFVPVGEKYAPDTADMCLQCTCDKNFPISCHSVRCSPPLNCPKAKLIEGTCCAFGCNDDSGTNNSNSSTDGNNNKEDGESITNLSLRLIASTVTSFLVLALLLFMVHRLRQRRLLQAMRRFEAHARQVNSEDTDSEPYIPDGFMSVECPPYTDPPPPYSPPKPPQIMPGEQPPPYEEINQNEENDRTLANEQRNENNSSSNLGTSGPVPPAAATVHNSESSVRNDFIIPSRTVETRHQRSVSSGGCPLRAPNTLPAYASTDVIDGIGVVITPGNDVVSYTPYSEGWALWLGDGHGSNERNVDVFSHQNSVPPTRDRPRSLGNPGTCRLQAMPTITAFQRFSNIFKRDSWKARNRRRHVRPVSEYGNLHQYATIPRNEAASEMHDANRPDDIRNPSRPPRNRFPDRMCMSYYSSQDAYNLGLVSPSSTSSNSSSSAEHQHYANSAVASSSNSNSPHRRDSSCLNNQSEANSSDRAHPKNDLNQHTSVQHAANNLTSPSRTWAREISASNQNSGTAVSGQAQLECRQYTRHEMVDSAVAREASPQRQFAMYGAPDSTYQSLASFIKSNPSTSLVNHRDAGNHLDRLVQSDTVGNISSRFLDFPEQNSSPEMLPRFFSTLPMKSFHPARSSSSHETEQRQPSSHPDHSASGSSSSSPSPSPASASSGVMKRSLSAVSQTSIFSVCSETGEKKLKSVLNQHDENTRVTADSKYPDCRSLAGSLTKTLNHTLPVGNITAGSISEVHERNQHSQVNIQPAFTSEDASFQSNRNTDVSFNSRTENVQELSTFIVNPTTTSSMSHSSQCSSVPEQSVQQACVVPELDDYNLNSLLVDKSPLNKDLPSLCHDLQLVNLPSSHVMDNQTTSKAGMNLSTQENTFSMDLNQPDSVVKSDKSHDVLKKQKKKRAKDKNVSSPQFLHLTKSKHNTNSPKHIRVHLVERKAEEMPDKVKPPRLSDKKLKAGLSKPSVRLSEPYNSYKLMTRSLCDGASAYGNADVYRSIGADVFTPGSSRPLPPPFCPSFTDPWVHQDHLETLVTANRTVLNNLNQPPNHLSQAPSYPNGQPMNQLKNVMFETSVGPPVMGTLVKFPECNLQQRKKSHRRTAPGDKSHASSPSRHKTRPKSLVVSSDNAQEKKDALPRSAAGDTIATNRGAKSGFGYDLNFVDQNRISDWHASQDPEYNHKRCTALGYDSLYLANTTNSFKLNCKADGTTDVPCAASKTPAAFHPGNKSGLSNELSFVFRNAGNANRSKKRQSVPASSSTFLTQNHPSTTLVNLSRPDEGEITCKFRGDKSSDMRHDRMTVSSDDYSEATSYV
ncbi:uncharacterized protein LOC106068462 [Biomphalaria glabrata]|uniref:Uncharacterized protein LOC106068462 n=1 Tax=Biomphalaria glabrata TaxID=6526 RepID=A0A9U8ED85_BIOGL|nr:uncharacterized protein LOC106068462 [Biomphalaria glabrata]XP_013083281.2 uncharacterized protein LOC106068462 [Biomphalaria glabrata]XP_013083282.2 uncharacterized protein LOC106068462 [Biomphalaria glabrata]XP_055862404.1 uncharacterized protein LOC106068462 [Biomphalaria glabrata]